MKTKTEKELEREIQEVISTVKPFGNGSHLIVPKEFEGKKIRVTLLENDIEEAVRLAKQEFNKKVEELKDKINAVYQDLVQWYNTHYPNFVLRKRGFEKILKRIEKIDKIFNSEKEEKLK